MKTFIVRPNYHSHLVTPPLGMGYVCAYLRQAGFDVHIIDGLKENIDHRELVSRCLGADLVGIFCMSDYVWDVIDLTRLLKEEGKTVVIGGPQASVMPGETLQYTGADYAVVGEGEETMRELVTALRGGEEIRGIPGLYQRGAEHFRPRDFFDDLDEIPFPAWDEIDPKTYPPAPHGAVVKAFPVAPVTSSRGCPFSCHFCASPKIWDRRIRYRSATNVVDEIELLVNRYRVREIHFEDDNLTLKRSHIEEICEEILRREIRVHWATPNGIRVDAASEDLFRLMKKSGCYSVAFGVETGSQKILDGIDKKTDLGMMRSAIRMAHKVGLITQAFIIFGLPGETVETIRETTEMALSLPLDKAQFLLLDILPGSRLWDTRGEFDINYFRKRSYQEPGFIPPGLTAEYLIKARSKAFRKFHLRPRQIYTILKLIKPGQIRFILRRIKDFSIF